MGWRFNRPTSRVTGIPKRLPNLPGSATHFALLDEQRG
jgi:hypothetical protein